jgi:hypothetical protein
MDFRNTHSWQMTLEFVPHLSQLADELPTAEEQGLKRHLHDIVVDLPTAISIDLRASGSTRRHEQLAKLQAALAVIETIYPAIDVTEVNEQVKALETRLMAANFTEQLPDPEESAGGEDV